MFDLEDPGPRVPFNKEQFKRMIERTFEDYYPTMYNLEYYDIEDYMKLV